LLHSSREVSPGAFFVLFRLTLSSFSQPVKTQKNREHGETKQHRSFGDLLDLNRGLLPRNL